ncbi:hypothetical protein GCM10027067_24930 [Pseudactinotalea suaedae]
MLIYLHVVAGLSVPTAGVLLTATGVGSLVVPALVGRLSMRFGARPVVIGGQLVQAIGTAGLLLAAVPVGRTMPVLALCCAMIGFGQRAFWSAVFTVIADTADHGAGSTGSWFALSGMAQGTGFAAGALAAGALLTLSGELPYLIAIAVNAVALLTSGLLLLREPTYAAATSDSEPTGQVHRDGAYLLLIGANTLFAFCSMVLALGLPLYVITALDVPAWVVGPLLAMNTVLGATCQGIAVRATQRFRQVRVMVAAGVIWAVWGLLTAVLTAAPAWLVLPALIVAVLVYSVAELIHAPVSMSLASAAAPKAARPSYLSWFQYSFALASVIGPGLFALSFGVSPSLPWVITAGVGLLGCVSVTVAGRALAGRLTVAG